MKQYIFSEAEQKEISSKLTSALREICDNISITERLIYHEEERTEDQMKEYHQSMQKLKDIIMETRDKLNE